MHLTSPLLVAVVCLHHIHTHYHVSEPPEQSPLCRLCKEISYHIPRWTPLYTQASFLYHIRDKEISNVDVLCPLPTGSLAVLLQKNSTLVILIYNVLSNILALCYHKQSSRQHCWHNIINAHQLTLGGTPGV